MNQSTRDTPIERAGGIYCSAGCGCGCTKAQYDEAQRKAESLAERMGGGWAPDVWENCMWHYALQADIDGVDVRLHHGYAPGKAREGHREGIDEYKCFINTSPQFIGKSTDPKGALKDALDQLMAHVLGLSGVAQALQALEKN